MLCVEDTVSIEHSAMETVENGQTIGTQYIKKRRTTTLSWGRQPGKVNG